MDAGSLNQVPIPQEYQLTVAGPARIERSSAEKNGPNARTAKSRARPATTVFV